MKRLLIIALGVFYLTLTCGVHVHVDTCCKKINKMFLSVASDSSCEVPVQSGSSDCCGTHEDCPTATIDMHLDHDGLMTSAPDIKVPITALVLAVSITDATSETETTYLLGFELDPPTTADPIFLTNSSFLLYG